ncbi:MULTISPECIES: hypothetical protein [Sphingobacterium]|uniref:hypothetical protein n=1 Tax=Sphingobacterium TaxID=28453 RepID=UPI000E9C791E|nr:MULTISPECIES: hypothetical protein [Sphingobacterium]HAU54324.1 hypothetical protein [Sphingobacterium sp.]HCX58088.1 hypothetical protein [Sphingobacterium sp.]
MKKLRSLLLIIFIGLGIANAQSNNKNKYVIDLPTTSRDTTFENLLHLLVASDYFVVSADKSSGFIQCKTVKDDSKVFTSLKVDILEYNLLIRENKDKGTRIYIQANLKQKTRTVSVNNDGVYNDDIGVTKKPKHYEPFIEFLESNLK